MTSSFKQSPRCDGSSVMACVLACLVLLLLLLLLLLMLLLVERLNCVNPSHT